ncbi:MAG: hypothetical protein ABSB76_35360 [Streptosporangiaceae bacterium]
MTLTFRQERILRRAEHALGRSDPDLASMLSIFARLTAAEGMPAREQLRPERRWDWRILLWPVASVVFVVVFVVVFAVVFAAGGGSKTATACGTACRRHAGGYATGRNGAGRAALDPASRPGLGRTRG